jgi:hypothetical protein
MEICVGILIMMHLLALFTNFSSLSLFFLFLFFFFLVMCVVEVIVEDDLYFEQKTKTNILINLLKTFEFASDLHLIKSILKIVYELS